MLSSIICLGNRLVSEDDSGPRVFDRLRKQSLPPGVEILEGGTAGLNLLPLIEGRRRVVFVDSVSGFTDSGNIVVLSQKTLTDEATIPQYGHDPGLPYVLSILPQVCEDDTPEEIFLIGLEGRCSAEIIERAAKMSVSITLNGL